MVVQVHPPTKRCCVFSAILACVRCFWLLIFHKTEKRQTSEANLCTAFLVGRPFADVEWTRETHHREMDLQMQNDFETCCRTIPSTEDCQCTGLLCSIGRGSGGSRQADCVEKLEGVFEAAYCQPACCQRLSAVVFYLCFDGGD